MPPQAELAIKPSWQVQAMQNVWAANGQQSRVTPLNTSPPQPTGYRPQSAMPTQPIIGQPGVASIPPQTPVYPPVMNTAAVNPADYPVVKHSKKWAIMVTVLVLLIVGGVVGLVALQRKHHTPPAPAVNIQELLPQVMATTFKTQTYNETLVAQTGKDSLTRSRQADFRKVGEPHVAVDNIIGSATADPVAVTVIGSSYYIKKHFTQDSLNKVADATRKQLLTTANDQWVLAIKDGQPVSDPTVAALNETADLQSMRVIIPSPLPIGYFRDDDQKTLTAFMTQNSVYTTKDTAPADDTITNQPVWRINVALNADKARELNLQIAKVIGISDTKLITDNLKDTLPDTMQIWARKSDKRLLQFSYKLGNTTYTYRYDKLDQAVDVNAPTQQTLPTAVAPTTPAPSTPAPATISDSDIKAAVDSVYTTLTDYQNQGNGLPSDDTTLREFVTQKINPSISSKYKLQYHSGVPSSGYIYYQLESSCSEDGQTFTPGESVSSFALLTKLSDSMYCVGG
ncbi:MAG TPA: hypothetical protein VLF60_03030 [Candidatus Saccharimonadales bacterium]|nr:hypothetical protein [Candidatus Saccharimonadales bacterium]